ncbi:MAG: TIGR04149 family rSAM-modified RiPP [Bacteroidales bacterium]|jgi:natural product precursor|nr:TIGR04149 family rSAM-modified RiPP [Bacteroidales bacterium]
MKKLEKLDATLFNEKIEKSEMSQVLGGENKDDVIRSYFKNTTYVTINTDSVYFRDDANGNTIECGQLIAR